MRWRRETDHRSCVAWIPCLGFLFLAACSSLVSNRIGPDQGCKIEYLQAGDRLLRLTMVNRSFVAHAARRGEATYDASRVSDSEMALLITRLEGLGYFQQAGRTRPADGGYIVIHLPAGPYYLGRNQSAWHKSFLSFQDLFNRHPPVRGAAAFDPAAEKRRLDLENEARRRKVERKNPR